MSDATSGELEIRPMYATDFECGFFETLSALRPTQMDGERAREVFRERMRDKLRTYVAVRKGRVVGTATLLLETKFIHNGGVVGHIEDVAVNPSEQGKGSGQALVKHLIDVSREAKAYKVILDCVPELVPFYEKVGFKAWCGAMRIDLDH